MADLIIGIVGDILGHIAVKDLKGSDVGSTDRTGCTDFRPVRYIAATDQFR